MEISKEEFQALKKEVTELRASVNFLMGYMNAKDPNFTYRPLYQVPAFRPFV